MITPILINWNTDYQNDGLLYFAQRIVEMLDYRTLDIFRTPLLNTPCLINEYLSISHGSAKAYNLEEVFHEFMDSFTKDIIIDYRNDLKNAAEKYAQRITWHLYRIYRARNSIVHTGKSPTNIKDIGEHLHAYVDSVANEVIIKLSYGTLCHTSNVLVDSELQQEKWDEYFTKALPIDNNTIMRIFASQSNYWNE